VQHHIAAAWDSHIEATVDLLDGNTRLT